MESRYSPRRDFTTLAPNEVTHRPLLRQGLESIRRGNFDEGISFLVLARAQLTPEHMHLASILDEIAEGYTAYCQLHEALLQAERNFAKADSEQQTPIATLRKLLSASEEAMNIGQSHNIKPDESSSYDQSSRGSGSHQSLVSSQSPSRMSDTLPGPYITCLRRFEVYRDNKLVVLCPNRNGQTILRYIVAQPGHCATADRLMASEARCGAQRE